MCIERTYKGSSADVTSRGEPRIYSRKKIDYFTINTLYFLKDLLCAYVTFSIKNKKGKHDLT